MIERKDGHTPVKDNQYVNVLLTDEVIRDGFFADQAEGLRKQMKLHEGLRKQMDTTPQPEYTGGSVSYYKVKVDAPLSGDVSYVAECNDIIEALEMNYAEGNAFKAIWRSCAARQGLAKRGYTDGVYDAEKVVFFGQRMVVINGNS